MKEKGYSFRAVIAGDGVLLNQLKDLATDLPELEFTGWITNKKEFFKKIDIFCQPSLFEPFGLTIIEAMAMSIPVISTDCDGPRDIIVSEKNGFIIPIRNSAFMSQVIIKLIGNSLLRNKIGEEGRKLIFKKYRINSLSVLLKKNIEKYYSEHSRWSLFWIFNEFQLAFAGLPKEQIPNSVFIFIETIDGHSLIIFSVKYILIEPISSVCIISE